MNLSESPAYKELQIARGIKALILFGGIYSWPTLAIKILSIANRISITRF